MACQANASVITFDDLESSPLAPNFPFVGHTERFSQAGIGVQIRSTNTSAQAGDLVGAIVDGSDLANNCVGLQCPTNNSSNFLAVLNEGYLRLTSLDSSFFSLSQFDASFIAAEGETIPSIAMQLYVDGFSGASRVASQMFSLAGATNNSLSFQTFSLLPSFFNSNLTSVGIYGVACVDNSCSTRLDKAQFAIDNIVTVPEPSAWLLIGLGLLAVGASRQRNLI